ncbi:hypothetical protein Zmor_020377 [Zophobas morio]|uniref:Uncharacterized protein n=1 Tax=Zophobas morio TaxID=2755281 RepID=A0AA38I7J8_9CUCU|nr:hypothetical protein Zmor_020377 [Zophobas morio]
MKVSLMAQVFSFKVGSLMKRISQWGLQYDNSLPAEAVQTADFILFMDMLFDSLNGNAKQAPVSKPFKGGVSTDSGHKKCNPQKPLIHLTVPQKSRIAQQL